MSDVTMDSNRSNWQRGDDMPPRMEIPQPQEPVGLTGGRKIGRDQMKALVDLIRHWLPEQNTQANPYSPSILFMALLEMDGGKVCELTENQAKFTLRPRHGGLPSTDGMARHLRKG